MKYYHVAKDWDGESLQSLSEIEGEADAIEIYSEKWPEAGGLAMLHCNVIHLHDNIEDARQFAADFGGEILEIDGDEIDVEIDDLEYPHPVCKHEIDADYICLVN